MDLYSDYGPLVASMKKTLFENLRYPLNLFFSVFPFIMITAWLVLSTIAFAGESGLDVGSYTVWGLVLYLIMNEMLWGVGNFFRREQKNGTLEQLHLSSSNPQLVIIGSILGSIITILLFNVIIVIGLAIILDISLINVLAGIYILFLSIILMIGVSLIFGSIIFMFKKGEVIINFSQLLILVLTGIFVPFGALPLPIKIISYIIPISFSVDMFRSTIMGVSPELINSEFTNTLGIGLDGYQIELIFLHALALFCLAFGLILLHRVIKKALKNQGLGYF